MKTNILFTVLTFLLLTPCPAQELNPVVVDDELKALIDQKNNTLERLYAEGKIDSAVTYFADNLIQLPPNSAPIRGKKAFMTEWNKQVAMGKWTFELEALEVRRSGPMAVELGQYSLTFTPHEQAPMPGFTDTGNYVVLWEKNGSDWQIVWDAPVSELPPGGAPDKN